MLNNIPQHDDRNEADQNEIERFDIVQIFHSASPSLGGRNGVCAAGGFGFLLFAEYSVAFSKAENALLRISYPPIIRSPLRDDSTVKKYSQIVELASCLFDLKEVFLREITRWVKYRFEKKTGAHGAGFLSFKSTVTVLVFLARTARAGFVAADFAPG
ncbi:hypothetical protein AAIB41_08810 [Brucella sp. BE17]|uniref:hypothetical protein n=1 Tax=Brucella sp. BE17 TaxID=3142977 RepID=UPI0031BB2750